MIIIIKKQRGLMNFLSRITSSSYISLSSAGQLTFENEKKTDNSQVSLRVHTFSVVIGFQRFFGNIIELQINNQIYYVNRKSFVKSQLSSLQQTKWNTDDKISRGIQFFLDNVEKTDWEKKNEFQPPLITTINHVERVVQYYNQDPKLFERKYHFASEGNQSRECEYPLAI